MRRRLLLRRGLACLLAFAATPLAGVDPAGAAGGGAVVLELDGAGYFPRFPCGGDCSGGALYGHGRIAGHVAVVDGTEADTAAFAVESANLVSAFNYTDVLGPTCPALGFGRGRSTLSAGSTSVSGAVSIDGAAGTVDAVVVDLWWTSVRVGAALAVKVLDAVVRVDWRIGALRGSLVSRSASDGLGVVLIPLVAANPRDYAASCGQSFQFNFEFTAAAGALVLA